VTDANTYPTLMTLNKVMIRDRDEMTMITAEAEIAIAAEPMAVLNI
jgi:hypothetical protein